MLTEADGECEAFDQQKRVRQHVRNDVKARARRDVVRQHKPELLDGAAQQQLERVLESCEKDADAIACEAAEEASGHASPSEPGETAYEVAYIEAYADALPALVATALVRCDSLDPAT